jgi:ATP-dependent exoDNAse (exonuclease V) beta subunit
VVGSAAVVRQMLAMLRLASGQQSSICEHLLASELGIADMESCKKFLTTLPRKSLPEAVEAIIGEYGLNKNPDHIPYLQAFQNLALSFASRKISDIGAFLEWWEQRGCTSKLACPEGQNAITIISIHQSKGLQFKVVLMPFVGWKIDGNMENLSGTTVWMNTGQSEPYCGLSCVPLSYSSKLADTIFAEQYEDEKQHALLDCLNMLYVAFTRAEEQLYVFAEQAMPSKKNGNMGSINVALWQLFSALQADDSALKFGQLDGRKTEQNCGLDGHSVVFEFGEMHAPMSDKSKSEQLVLAIDEYPSRLCSTLRCNSVESWRSERSTPVLSGSKMHKIIEHIATAADVEQAVMRCIDEGLATADEHGWLCAEVHQLIAHPHVAQWFDGSWTLLREADIVLGKGEEQQTTLRPDRVMLKGFHAVVLDYKFGVSRHHRSEHRNQVQTYISALQAMGYQTRGYLWYVTTEEVIEV